MACVAFQEFLQGSTTKSFNKKEDYYCTHFKQYDLEILFCSTLDMEGQKEQDRSSTVFCIVLFLFFCNTFTDSTEYVFITQVISSRIIHSPHRKLGLSLPNNNAKY